MEVTRDFPRRSDQAPRVRTFVRRALAAWGVSRSSEDVVLIASELFSNAVLHGAGVAQVRLVRGRDGVRVEVLDGGSGAVPTVMSPAAAASITGRGLRIVDRLASSWGTTRDRDGTTTVWAELAL
jgi:anti-sigma regulatory factor (Ser/Thr protein kinase)